MPADIPVTRPEVPETAAIAVLLLLQDPPGVAFESNVDEPAQTVLLPVIAAGAVITVTTFVTEQLPTVYVIVAVPGATPNTIPAVGVTAATDELLLLQVPPATEFVSTIVEPTQTLDGPPIAGGPAVTVTVLVAEHPPIM